MGDDGPVRTTGVVLEWLDEERARVEWTTFDGHKATRVEYADQLTPVRR